jgi:DNA primase small subunit
LKSVHHFKREKVISRANARERERVALLKKKKKKPAMTTTNETLGESGERKEDVKRQKLMEDDDDFEKNQALVKEEAVDVHSLMRPYYAHIFPSKQLFEWLSYEGLTSSKESQKDQQQFIQNREFCFTLKGEIFVRYNSYADEKSLRKDLKTKVPGKIDIGPVFSHNPKNRLAYGGSFKPVERELVFDIDMTDYDDVRTCCDQAKICPKCWPLMNCAVKVLDVGLREDFGFEHILWVYSGRRGIHAWVCDERARKLSDEERSAVAEYFSVFKGVEGGGEKKKTNLSFGSGKRAKMHPRLEEAYWKVLKPFWEKEFLPAQKLMESKKHFETILSMIPDATVRQKAEFDFNNNKMPTVSRDGDIDVNTWRWQRIVKAVEDELRGKNTNWDLTRCLQTIIFSHVYPRLDAEVSKHMNHLLKAPFCVHPKTGRVCVPIDPSNCDAFDPFSSDAPKVHELLQEYKKFGADENAVKKTAMGKALETFERCFWSKLKVANEEEKKKKMMMMNNNVLNESNALNKNSNAAADMEF